MNLFNWEYMKRIRFTAILAMCSLLLHAQTASSPFKGYFYNKEYNVYLRINFYDNIMVPEHEIFGNLPGYIGKEGNSFFWLITEVKGINEKQANINVVNDYGSEDFTATFSMENDSTYILKQESGSILKVPNKGKWQKLPKIVKFIKH